MRVDLNQKYEITDIPHEQYPFLHRIRALQDIGEKVKAGDLGGFVESESNLSVDPEDDAWIFDNAICCGTGYVDQDSRMFGEAIVCHRAYLSHGGEMSAEARAEDDSYIRGAVLCGHARASGNSMILAIDGRPRPVLSEHCAVYGTVRGDIHVMGTAVVISGEEISNDTLDTFVILEAGCSIIRDASRDQLKPQTIQPKAPKKKKEAVR